MAGERPPRVETCFSEGSQGRFPASAAGACVGTGFLWPWRRHGEAQGPERNPREFRGIGWLRQGQTQASKGHKVGFQDAQTLLGAPKTEDRWVGTVGPSSSPGNPEPTGNLAKTGKLAGKDVNWHMAGYNPAHSALGQAPCAPEGKPLLNSQPRPPESCQVRRRRGLGSQPTPLALSRLTRKAFVSS